MMSARQFGRLVLLGLVVAIGWWLSDVFRTQAPGLPLQTHESDYSMQHFTLVAMHEDGTPRYTLQGESLHHLPDTDISLLSRPEFELHQQPTWQAVAQRGEIASGNEPIDLYDDVVLVRQRESRTATLYTQSLRVWTSSKKAETTAAVKIVNDRQTVHARGLHADLAADTLQLLADVRSLYEAR